MTGYSNEMGRCAANETCATAAPIPTAGELIGTAGMATEEAVCILTDILRLLRGRENSKCEKDGPPRETPPPVIDRLMYLSDRAAYARELSLCILNILGN